MIEIEKMIEDIKKGNDALRVGLQAMDECKALLIENNKLKLALLEVKCQLIDYGHNPEGVIVTGITKTLNDA